MLYFPHIIMGGMMFSIISPGDQRGPASPGNTIAMTIT